MRVAAYRVARGVWSKTPLHTIGNRVAGVLPDDVQARFTRAKQRARYHTGEELVPAESLQATFAAALETLGPDADGDYLEFGVYLGASLLCMQRATEASGHTAMRLIGFDSFQGLPDAALVDDEGVWTPGQFDADIELAREHLTEGGVDWSRTILVPGWYDETLTPELAERLELTKASVVMIDCDMYLSAAAALRFCAPLLHGRSVLVFDDWHTHDLAERGLGERKAFEELLEQHPLRVVGTLPAYNETSHVVVVEAA